jgi:hypothetical protein
MTLRLWTADPDLGQRSLICLKVPVDPVSNPYKEVYIMIVARVSMLAGGPLNRNTGGTKTKSSTRTNEPALQSGVSIGRS